MWEDKFAANVTRDAARASELRKLGFKVVTVWECETFNPEQLNRRLIRSFRARDA